MVGVASVGGEGAAGSGQAARCGVESLSVAAPSPLVWRSCRCPALYVHARAYVLFATADPVTLVPQVDAEHAMETNTSDNFVSWHIRQFMDDPAKTAAQFYQHVADRKAAAEEVYACLRVLQPRRAAAQARPLCRGRVLPDSCW